MQLSPKKLLVVAALLGIGVLVLLILIVFPQQPISSPQPGEQTPTPITVITRNVNVVSVTPPNLATNVSIYPNISVVFSEALSPQERPVITVSSSPSVPGTYRWSINNKTLTFIFNKRLLFNQKYQVSINGLQQRYTWTFSTEPEKPLTQQEEGRAQGIADKNYGDAWTQIYKDFPWYKSFPIQTSQYFVYFNLTKKSFIAKLYPKSSSVPDLQKEITSRLQTLGVNTITVPITWEVQQ